VLALPGGARLAFSTDSFVVRPLRFLGGSIGHLAVHGTVNDLAVSGARPAWLSAAFAIEEHRQALRTVLTAAEADGADPLAVACAVDWLLYDWLMAHRDGPDSGAIEIPKGREHDAALIIDSAAASVTARATIDPGLLDVPTGG
jgi:AIR synthase related protein, N-terminal domain